jgi:hypothetical protein
MAEPADNMEDEMMDLIDKATQPYGDNNQQVDEDYGNEYFNFDHNDRKEMDVEDNVGEVYY